MTAPQDYEVFGLIVRSAVPLPELFPAEGARAPDVVIRTGTVASVNAQPGLHALEEALVLNVPDVGRYRIEHGREIVVDSNDGAPARNLRLFLLGSAFGALLHQRGLLPLHANAVEIEGKAVAFMGESGAGKSTLAAWFHDRGHRIIADDVCVVGFDEAGIPYASPGLPRLRLWREALELMGRSSADFHRSYAGSGEEFDKYDVPISMPSASRSRIELRGLYVLQRGEAFEVRQLHGIEAADAIFANTYRGAFIAAAGKHLNHWESAIRLVRSLPVHRVSRAWDLTRLDDQNGRLIDYLSTQSPVSMARGAAS